MPHLLLALVILLAACPGMAAAAEIAPSTVNRLAVVATLRTQNPHGHAGKPVVDRDSLFFVTPFPHSLYALDLRRPGFPVRWRYQPTPNGLAEGLACCDLINAGPVVADGHVVFNTLDGHTIALNEADGTVAWDTATADPGSGATLTSSPTIVHGKVLVGNAGDDYGVRGWIAALDAATGREIWRRFSTGPDADVGIGSGFKPFYDPDRGTDRGVATWTTSAWQHGGGSVSGPILYDPELNLVLHGTGHPAPWNPDQHRGDNKWTSGLFAREPDSGDARWFVQFNPHDLFALGSAVANVAVDREWQGQPRKLLIHPDPNGYLYVLDRATGEMLSAEPFTNVNATQGVDLGSGTLKRDDSRAARVNTMTRDVCPGWPGAATGTPALAPDQAVLFIPVSRLCMDLEARNTTFIQGTAFIGDNIREKSPPDGMRGALVAWDIAGARPIWTVTERFPVASGALAVNGVVFFGTLEGTFKAVDAKNGHELWRFQTSSGIIGEPMAFQGPDGRSYVAVLAGLGGPFGTVARNGIDRRDATAALGMGNALGDLPPPSDPSGTLYVFGLP